MIPEIQKLAQAGAEFGALAANSCHMAFDQISQRSPIPLISIVETAREAAEQLKLKTLGLFGAGFTMKAPFYEDVFSKEKAKRFPPFRDKNMNIKFVPGAPTNLNCKIYPLNAKK